VNWGQPGLVVVVIGSTTNAATPVVNSITLDGVSMIFAPNTKQDYLQTELYRAQTQIYYANMATSSGQLIVNYSVTVKGFAAFVYRLDNLNSTTPEYSNSAQSASSTSISLTTTSLSANSVGVGGHLTRATGPVPTFTNWDADGAYSRFFGFETGGSFTQATANTRTITVTNTPAGNQRHIIYAAVWR
jgi:hypothetical protein